MSKPWNIIILICNQHFRMIKELFCLNSFVECIFYIYSTFKYGPATFQVLNGHMWQVATMLVSKNAVHFTCEGKWQRKGGKANLVINPEIFSDLLWCFLIPSCYIRLSSKPKWGKYIIFLVLPGGKKNKPGPQRPEVLEKKSLFPLTPCCFG